MLSEQTGARGSRDNPQYKNIIIDRDWDMYFISFRIPFYYLQHGAHFCVFYKSAAPYAVKNDSSNQRTCIDSIYS